MEVAGIPLAKQGSDTHPGHGAAASPPALPAPPPLPADPPLPVQLPERQIIPPAPPLAAELPALPPPAPNFEVLLPQDAIEAKSARPMRTVTSNAKRDRRMGNLWFPDESILALSNGVVVRGGIKRSLIFSRALTAEKGH